MKQEIFFKVCSQCNKLLPPNEFNKDRRRSDNLRAICRECQSKWQLEYRTTHHNYYLLRHKEYYKANREKFKIYGQNNRDKKLKYHHNYHQKHKEEIAARKKIYKLTHLDLYRSAWCKRRAKEKGNGGFFTPKEWNDLCEKYGHYCLMCGKSDIPLTVDHIIPISLGGTNNIDNIQPLCQICNSQKGIKIIDYR